MHHLSEAAPMARGGCRLSRRAAALFILAISAALWAVVILSVKWVLR